MWGISTVGSAPALQAGGHRFESDILHSFLYLVNAMTYSQQRKERMGDCIGDYLMDDDVDARQCYEEMLDEVNSQITYHRTQMRKAQQLKELMLGHRPIDLDGRPGLLD